MTTLQSKQYAMGATVKGLKLDLIEFQPPALGDDEVFVDIKYCGMCHSDLHKINNEWEDCVAYPMVPGHEVVGTVAAVGSKVTKIKVGQTVGFGPQRNSCKSCEFCADAVENCCPKFEGLYDPKFGGYATSITVNQDFAFPIPEGIPMECVGPLLCAGITTFSPLDKYAKAGDKVGIVGVGGLGHMGVQYAAAMGCHTVAISTSTSKQAEAAKFGATSFLVSTDAAAMNAAAGTFDFILCTAAANFAPGDYLKLLKPTKTFCLVGLPSVEEKLGFVPFDIVAGEKKIVGSMIGGTAAMTKMLQFSADKKCFPQVEVIDFSAANEGVAKVLANSARYRVVLKIEGFREAQQ